MGMDIDFGRFEGGMILFWEAAAYYILFLMNARKAGYLGYDTYPGV
jgi:hypothetical protein